MKAKLYYLCNPELNTTCSKSTCHINGGRCKRTSNPKFSFDNKITWPEIKHGCLICPLGQLECMAYPHRPCQLFKTYTDFRMATVLNVVKFPD